MTRGSKPNGFSEMNGDLADGGGGGGEEWELRPGGMLVQKRNPDSDRDLTPAPTIKVKVKFQSIYHEIVISSQATFGELRKRLTAVTGIHHEDQRLMFKEKERSSKEFLDISGVKDKSKIVLIEDPIGKEKRMIEMRRNAKIEKAAKALSAIGLEIDRLAGRVSAFESIISKGGKVVEMDVVNLIEVFMNQLVKLDGIVGDGDVKLKREIQVKRVQKYVETLDMLKIKNSMPQNQQRPSNVQRPKPIQQQQQQKPPKYQTSGPVVVTTKWETFDSTPPLINLAAIPIAANNSGHPKFNWEIFG